jgi:hypothetical protein
VTGGRRLRVEATPQHGHLYAVRRRAAGADRPPRTADHADRWLRGDPRYPAATRPARAGPPARARTRPPDAAGTMKARSRQREPPCSRRERSRNS